MNIGDIVTSENYTQGAIWCNNNNAHIELINGQYVIVENVVDVPTVEEQIAEIDAQYEEDKEQLLDYYTEALILDDTVLQADIKAELTALNDQYDADITALTEV